MFHDYDFCKTKLPGKTKANQSLPASTCNQTYIFKNSDFETGILT